MTHSHPHTLNLLKRTIARAPSFFPAADRLAMEDRAEALETSERTSRSAVERAIVECGRTIWPYKKAYLAIHRDHRSARERALMREAIAEAALRTKFDAFLSEGGQLSDVRRGSKRYADFFTPIQRQKIAAAHIEAHTQLTAEVHDLCRGSKKGACSLLLEKYSEAQRASIGAISRLRTLAARTRKWKQAILDHAEHFELGWSGVEQEPELPEIEATIEYYRGRLREEGFLNHR